MQCCSIRHAARTHLDIFMACARRSQPRLGMVMGLITWASHYTAKHVHPPVRLLIQLQSWFLIKPSVVRRVECAVRHFVNVLSWASCGDSMWQKCPPRHEIRVHPTLARRRAKRLELHQGSAAGGCTHVHACILISWFRTSGHRVKCVSDGPS